MHKAALGLLETTTTQAVIQADPRWCDLAGERLDPPGPIAVSADDDRVTCEREKPCIHRALQTRRTGIEESNLRIDSPVH